MTEPLDSSPPRRRFLQVLFGGSLAALAAVAGGIMARYLAPIAGDVLSVIAGHLTDFTEAKPVKMLKVGLKDVMLRRMGDKLIALDLKCSHAGCTVHWQPEQNNFKCPCHGGMYATDGKVIKGPPPRPLGKLRVSVGSNGEITVTDLPA